MSICRTMSSANSMPPSRGTIPVARTDVKSLCLYRPRSHLRSGASQPLPKTDLNAAPSSSSHRSMWGSGTARTTGETVAETSISLMRCCHPLQLASVATTIRSGWSPCCVKSVRYCLSSCTTRPWPRTALRQSSRTAKPLSSARRCTSAPTTCRCAWSSTNNATSCTEVPPQDALRSPQWLVLVVERLFDIRPASERPPSLE